MIRNRHPRQAAASDSRPRVLITCEHGGRRIPRRYAHLFRDAEPVLDSHRGFDPGSLALARIFARRLSAPLVFSTVSRLLVELNRSVSHPAVFSEFTRPLDRETKQEILAKYYRPHRERVESIVAETTSAGRTLLHLSIHTFTPQLGAVRRNADVGLLYDPARPHEKQFCRLWQQTLRARRPDLRVRRNYPYLGQADGLTTHLRRRFRPALYLGVELEVNQSWPAGPLAAWRRLRSDLVDAFIELQV